MRAVRLYGQQIGEQSNQVAASATRRFDRDLRPDFPPAIGKICRLTFGRIARMSRAKTSTLSCKPFKAPLVRAHGLRSLHPQCLLFRAMPLRAAAGPQVRPRELCRPVRVLVAARGHGSDPNHLLCKLQLALQQPSTRASGESMINLRLSRTVGV